MIIEKMHWTTEEYMNESVIDTEAYLEIIRQQNGVQSK